MRPLLVSVAAVVALSACGGTAVPIDDVAELPPITPAEVGAILDESERPIVLNVWASWCVPCRSEAPLLRTAHGEFGDRVRFIGIDVEDDQEAARRFLAEFGLTGFEHYADPSGAVPTDLTARGVPLTFFFLPGGELLHLHRGVIDERALAVAIDELLRARD